MIRWLEENGYNVSYTSEYEVANNGALLKNHKIFMSSGHDEYWSASQRANVVGRARSGREPRVLQRQRDLLEDALGAEHRRLEHALPDADHLQGDPLRTHPVDPEDPADLDRGVARPAVQPAGRRRAARRTR